MTLGADRREDDRDRSNRSLPSEREGVERESTSDVDPNEIEALLAVDPADVDPAGSLTFARNVFVPLTTACRYTCSYCTYYDDPGEASLMSPDAVREVLRTGAAAGCTEALFTFGDRPDARYERIHAQLREWGYGSIHEYLRAACETALDVGLLPHSNPGDLTGEEMASLADVNASMGVMLETTADVPAHSGPRRKTPEQRLRTLENAGRLRVPFTTGILVGIGEGWRDRAESLLAIRNLHERYGHVQEVIVQPVVPNERWRAEGPSVETLGRVVAMARVSLPEAVSVQVPPNLAPTREVLACGVDDLGGVSPVTDDYINPEYAWPALDELEAIADYAGVPLHERLPVYERYLPDGLGSCDDGKPADADRRGDSGGSDDRGGPVSASNRWISDRIVRAIEADDAAGRRYRSVLAGPTNCR